MDRVGSVWNENNRVGTITESSTCFSFSYEPEWKRVGFPIGFGFPFSRDIYYSATLFPFFENLLSEGWLRRLQSSEESIDTTDSFGLLLANGADLPGAFSVKEEHV